MAGLKWLLVGTGDIANKRVAPALAESENSEIVAVCDLRKEEADKLAEKMNVSEIYTDYATALKESSADAVYLATPIWLHTEQAIQALEAGKNVLVEKPLALTAEDCDKVIAAAEKSGKTAGCSYYRRSFNRYKFTKEMIENGEFGDVINIRMTMFSWFNPTEDDPKYWRVIRNKSGGGPLSDMGTHMFDVLIGLLGMPEKVFAKCANLGTKAADEGWNFKIHTPLQNLNKSQIIKLGNDLGVDYAMTHSCYNPSTEGLACGKCESCEFRRKGFHEAGIPDPTNYGPTQK